MEELFQSVKTETLEPIATTITGSIPEWIKGSLYRNGPGKYEFGDTKYCHWFDGMAMVHRFKISNGTATYQNQFIASDTYKKNTRAERIVVTEFGTAAYADPCKTCFQKFFSYFQAEEITDNTLVNLFPLGDALYACTESNFINRIDDQTLEKLEKVDLAKLVSVHTANAHPHIDKDGSVHMLGSQHGRRTNYTIVKITPPKEGDDGFCKNAEIVAKVPAHRAMRPSYHHSFAITENYYVFIEQPMVINVWKLITTKLTLTAFPVNSCMEWNPEHPVKFHIIDRKTGLQVNEEVRYEAEAFFTFHHVNAYEEDDCIVIDTVAYGKETDVEWFITQELSLIGLRAEKTNDADRPPAVPFVRRHVLPVKFDKTVKGKNLVTIRGSPQAILNTGKVKANSNITLVMSCEYELISNTPIEFPQINYNAVNGRKYRYIFGGGIYGHAMMKSLVKIDTVTKTSIKWCEEDVFPSEPVFVATPGAEAEDDGVLLSVVLTTGGPTRCAFLLILDARNMKEIGRARADVQIGLGFHGIFLPNK